MKFSCTQENINYALTIVGRIANRTPNLPILQNVLLEAKAGGIVIASTNLEIGVRMTIRGKVEQEGKFTIPAQLLANYINLLSAERIDCVLEKKNLHINAGSQQTQIKGEEATEFPLLPDIEREHSYTINRVALELGLQQTVIAASVDETRPEIAGVLFSFQNNKLTLAATDSYRLAEKKLDLEQAGDEHKIILPYRAAQELLRIIQLTKIDHVAVLCSDTQLACIAGEIEFVSRLVEGVFPEYEQIIPSQSSTEAELDCATLLKAVKGAALFSKVGINDIELVISAAQQAMTVRSTNAQLGENSTVLPAQVRGQDVRAVFNYRYVVDGIQQVQRQTSTTVCCGVADSTSPGVLYAKKDPSFHYIIMPIKQ
ncbi:MAG: DNA polymerase III subunit beta [Candidatus Kerfeldbacteria bacterium]|nr:DNA polymerase III subunit beta [Candidatus Kerfeldbacteria bacterium]